VGQVDSQAGSEDARTRVFLSYSRKDAALVVRVADGLLAAGLLADYDQAAHDPHNVSAGISAEDEWWKRLQEMIAAADVMVFLVSPDSAASTVCDEEIAYARALGKRIIAVQARPVDFAKAPPRLSALNVRINFSETGPGFDAALAELVSALAMNVGWHREGRKYMARVQEWDTRGRPRSLLLREGAVEEAERWAVSRPRNEPEPGELFLAWIAAGREQIRRDAVRRAFWRRVTAVFVLTTLIATLAGAWFVVNGQRNLGRSESLMLARTSDQFYNQGDHLSALRLAILASRESFLDPSTDEARVAFARSAQALTHQVSVRQVQPGGGAGDSIISAFWISPEHDRMVTTNYMDLTFVWDMKTGAQLGETLALSGSMDNQHLETAESGRHVVVWDHLGAHILSLEDGTRVGGLLGIEEGETGHLTTVALSADGRRVATGAQGSEVRVYDVASGQKLTELPARLEGVPSVRLSADGEKLLAIYTGRAVLADAGTGAILIGPLDTEGPLYQDGFLSPDGRRAVLQLGSGDIEIWNTDTGERMTRTRQSDGYVERAVFMTAAPRIVTVSASGIVEIWDSETGAMLGEPIRTEGWSGAVQVNPGDTQFLTRTYMAGLQLWDVSTGEGLLEINDEMPAWDGMIRNPRRNSFIAWDGNQIAELFTGQGRIESQPIVYEHPGFVQTVTLSPDGRLALTSNEVEEARLWDLVTGVQIAGPFRHTNAVVPARFINDQSFVTLDEDTASVWTVPHARRIAFTGETDLGEFVMGKLSPDGERLLMWNDAGRAVLRDTSTGRQVGREILLGNAGDWGAVFDPASSLMLTWFEGAAQVTDSATGEVREGLLEHDLPLRDAAFALGGRRLVTLSGENTITLWNAETLTRIRDFETAMYQDGMPPIQPVLGRMVILDDEAGQLYDLETGSEAGAPMEVAQAPAGEPEASFEGVPLRARFSPDGSRLVVYSLHHAGLFSSSDAAGIGEDFASDREFYLAEFTPVAGQVALLDERGVTFADLNTGAMAGRELAHPDIVSGLWYSPDGSQIVTVADDRMLRFWDARTGEALGKPIVLAVVEQEVIYSDDGRSLVAIEASGFVRVIDTATISLLYSWYGSFTHGDMVWQQDAGRLLVWDNERQLISLDLTDAGRLDALTEDVQAVCGSKLQGMHSPRGQPFVREIDEATTFAAPILRGREGEDVCTPPLAPWWERAAGAVFGWAFR